jgi:hypothetical protein
VETAAAAAAEIELSIPKGTLFAAETRLFALTSFSHFFRFAKTVGLS